MLVAIEKYPRRRIRWAWFLLVMVILFVLPIAALYVMVYDGNSKRVVIQDNFTMAEFGNRILVDSLDPAPQEKIMDVGSAARRRPYPVVRCP